VKPDLTKINPDFKPGTAAPKTSAAVWKTNEQIEVKALFTAEDMEGMQHLDYLSGLPPFLRGPYPSMFVQRPWTIRQYADFPPPKRPTHSIAAI
jgi:methylmalonyl-CoA mutase